MRDVHTIFEILIFRGLRYEQFITLPIQVHGDVSSDGNMLFSVAHKVEIFGAAKAQGSLLGFSPDATDEIEPSRK